MQVEIKDGKQLKNQKIFTITLSLFAFKVIQKQKVSIVSRIEERVFCLKKEGEMV